MLPEGRTCRAYQLVLHTAFKLRQTWKNLKMRLLAELETGDAACGVCARLYLCWQGNAGNGKSGDHSIGVTGSYTTALAKLLGGEVYSLAMLALQGRKNLPSNYLNLTRYMRADNEEGAA